MSSSEYVGHNGSMILWYAVESLCTTHGSTDAVATSVLDLPFESINLLTS